MAGPVEPLRVLAAAAHAAAARVLRNPALSGILVDLTRGRSRLAPARFQFAFQEVRHGLFGGGVLKTCWVDVSLQPRSVTAGPVNTFGRQQLQQLASITGFSFPPEFLDLGELRVEPADILNLVTEGSLAPGATTARLELGLCRHEGHLAWRVLQELQPVGVRTLFVDATSGHVLHEQVDPGTGAPRPPRGDAPPGPASLADTVVAPRPDLRQATLADADAVADVYLRSRKELVACAPLAHSDDDVREWIRTRLIPGGRTTVAVVEGQVVAILSVSPGAATSWIDHLYVRPDWVGHAIGTRLLEVARRQITPPIRLYTFQENAPARRFYESRGFRAIAFGDGSLNEERCPDVLYEWHPDAGAGSAREGDV